MSGPTSYHEQALTLPYGFLNIAQVYTKNKFADPGRNLVLFFFRVYKDFETQIISVSGKAGSNRDGLNIFFEKLYTVDDAIFKKPKPAKETFFPLSNNIKISKS